MKVLCVVQARMGSERLPGKVMKDVMGKPMITYTLDRVSQARYVDETVLATSVKDTEEEMVKYLRENGYKVFRGDENNVLERYVKAQEAHGGDVIVRVTGDCPFIDPAIIDNVITQFLMNQFDYVRLDVPDTFIRGFDVEVFSKEAMLRVYEIAGHIEGDSPYKEHVTYYMYRHPKEFKIGFVKGNDFYAKDYRLCVDTKEDFELVTKVYEHFSDGKASAKEIVTYLDEHQEIACINQEIEQKHV